MAEIQDDAARSEVVLGEALARVARVERRAEEREVRLDPIGPLAALRTGHGVFVERGFCRSLGFLGGLGMKRWDKG